MHRGPPGGGWEGRPRDAAGLTDGTNSKQDAHFTHCLWPILGQAQLAPGVLMGAGLGTEEENGKLRGWLWLGGYSHACCLPYSAHLSNTSPSAGREARSLPPSVQQLLDTPAAEQHVGGCLQGPLQALPRGAHLYDRHSESSVSQGPSKGEGEGLG